jgi:cytochrome c biogenesis protein CcdA
MRYEAGLAILAMLLALAAAALRARLRDRQRRRRAARVGMKIELIRSNPD